jgi:hypothetical protein
MKTSRIAARRVSVAALLVVALAGTAVAEEKLVGTYGEVRTILAFKAPEVAVQKLLPEGWEAVPAATGPSQGANLNLVFVDSITLSSPAGKAADTVRVSAVAVPARKKGTTVPMVVGGLTTTNYAPGAYGNFAAAKVTTARHLNTDVAGASTVEEAWEFIGDAGDKVQLQLKYTRGAAAYTKAESKPHSAVKPDFYRIYRFEQAADLVRSTATNVDRAQTVSFTASGPKMSQVFDGKEQLVSITSLPFYTRQVLLPDGMEQPKF